MPDFIDNITAAITDVWSSALGLFTILAIIALGIALFALLFSSRNSGEKNEALSRIVLVLVACAGFGAITNVIMWAIGLS